MRPEMALVRDIHRTEQIRRTDHMKTVFLRLVFLAFAIGGSVAIWWVSHDPHRWTGDTPNSFAQTRDHAHAKMKEKGLRTGQPVYIRIFKKESVLELWMRNEEGWALLRNFDICKWSGRLGPKLKEGDRQSPEGFYQVTRASLNPNSAHHLSFNLGFPNRFDRAHGRTGSFLMVHGNCSSIGCYAMTNPAIDVIYNLVEAALKNGQAQVPVHIFPFRMTAVNMGRHRKSKWTGFWKTLQPAWAAFNQTREVPKIKIRGKRYLVTANTN